MWLILNSYLILTPNMKKIEFLQLFKSMILEEVDNPSLDPSKNVIKTYKQASHSNYDLEKFKREIYNNIFEDLQDVFSSNDLLRKAFGNIDYKQSYIPKFDSPLPNFGAGEYGMTLNFENPDGTYQTLPQFMIFLNNSGNKLETKIQYKPILQIQPSDSPNKNRSLHFTKSFVIHDNNTDVITTSIVNELIKQIKQMPDVNKNDLMKNIWKNITGTLEGHLTLRNQPNIRNDGISSEFIREKGSYFPDTSEGLDMLEELRFTLFYDFKNDQFTIAVNPLPSNEKFDSAYPRIVVSRADSIKPEFNGKLNQWIKQLVSDLRNYYEPGNSNPENNTLYDDY